MGLSAIAKLLLALFDCFPNRFKVRPIRCPQISQALCLEDWTIENTIFSAEVAKDASIPSTFSGQPGATRAFLDMALLIRAPEGL
jgi:hypothetical protein